MMLKSSYILSIEKKHSYQHNAMALQTTLNCTLELDSAQLAVLDDRCELLSYLERILYKDFIIAKKDINQLKSQYIANYDINARQFNAVRIQLEGRVTLVMKQMKERLQDKEALLKKQKAKVQSIEKTKLFYEHKQSFGPLTLLDHQFADQTPKKMWYAKQRLQRLESSIKKIKDSLKTGNPHICFGGKKLFLQQFQIDGPNNLTSFKTRGQCLKAWKDKRKQQFTSVGSKGETAGNTNTQLNYDSKTKEFSLQINVAPKAIKHQDKYITVKLNVFNHKDMLLSAIANNQAISYRFYKDFKKNEYRVFVSFDKSKSTPKIKSISNIGTIGIDINYGFVSVVETDRYGNRQETFDMPLELTGLTSNQNKDKIAILVREIADYASYIGKPIVLEDLNFAAKKKSLQSGVRTKYNTMLSSFAYSKILTLFEGRCFDKGIKLISVNPAYTSVIGRLKYKNQGYKISVHQAAAWCIARRGMNLKEKRKVFSAKHDSWTVAEQSCPRQDHDFWKQTFKSWRKYKTGLSKLRQKPKTTPNVVLASQASVLLSSCLQDNTGIPLSHNMTTLGNCPNLSKI